MRVSGDVLHEDTGNGAEVEERDITQEWDDVTGKVFDPKLILEGKTKELGKLQRCAVCTYNKRVNAEQDMTVKFINARYVLTAEGGEVRSPFVAQQIAQGDLCEDLFAGTPPLFAARLLVSQAASTGARQPTLIVLDISCAFLYSDVKRALYIELPEEVPERKGGGETRQGARRCQRCVAGLGGGAWGDASRH